MKHFITSNFTMVLQIACLLAIPLLLLSCTKNSNIIGGGGNSLSDPSIKPVVIFTLPANGAVGPLAIYNRGDGSSMPSFVVQFNKLMSTYSFKTGSVTCTGFDKPVVVRLHSVYYPVPIVGDKSDQGATKTQAKSINLSNHRGKQINSDYDDILEFDIRDSVTYAQMPYSVGKAYTIRIDTTLQDINGNYLQSPYTFSFTPEPNFRVVGSYPPNGQNGVSPNSTYISVTFNSPLLPSVLSQFQINPTASGSWILSSDSTYVYFQLANNNLSYNTTYSVRIPTSVGDRYGHHLNSEYVFNFTTAPFQVSYTYPQDGTTNLWPVYFRGINVNFNGNIDTNSVKSAFTISPNVPGYFHNYFRSSSFSFNLYNIFKSNTNYTVTISTAMKSLSGTSLSSPYSFSFFTAPFQVTGITPSAYDPGNSVMNRNEFFNVFCNATIDTSTARPAFSISPNVNGTIGFNNYQAIKYNSFAFYPSSELAANTSYTVTISKSLKAFDGTPLSQNYSATLTTGPY